MKMRNMSKNALAVAVGAGLVAAPVLSAQAYEFSISGQINRTIAMVDNGDDDSIFHGDNDDSSSRLRAGGSGDFGNGKAGFNWEHQFESNSDITTTLPNVSAGGDSDSMRKAEVWFSGDYGKISIGQGSDAIDGISERDYGGTEWVAGIYNYPVSAMGSISFVNSTGAPVGPTVSAAITSFDGGRRDRIRYDSPTLGGALSFAISLANGEQLDASISGSHDFGASKFGWAIGINDAGDIGGTVTTVGGAIEADNIDPSRTIGSAALKIGNWAFHLSFADVDLDLVTPREDPSATYAKVSYTADSGHSFGVGTGTWDDLAADRDEAEVIQFGWGYSPNSSVDIAVGWTEAELDRPGVNLDDVTALKLGVRVKFK